MCSEEGDLRIKPPTLREKATPDIKIDKKGRQAKKSQAEKDWLDRIAKSRPHQLTLSSPNGRDSGTSFGTSPK